MFGNLLRFNLLKFNWNFNWFGMYAEEEERQFPAVPTTRRPSSMEELGVAEVGEGCPPAGTSSPGKHGARSLAASKTYTVLVHNPGGGEATRIELPPLLFPSKGAEESTDMAAQFQGDPNRALAVSTQPPPRKIIIFIC